MERHKAIIVGAGRIGVGRGWAVTPYVYTHAGAYAALRERVELVGVVDTSEEARSWVSGIATYEDLRSALDTHHPSIVSVCTPPGDNRRAILEACEEAGVRGVWCEKPFGVEGWAGQMKVQVNYIRRFDPAHTVFGPSVMSHPYNMIQIVGGSGGVTYYRPPLALFVWAKKDATTVCHFTDLARFCGIAKGGLHYQAIDGPCSYVIRRYGWASRDSGYQDTLFYNGGVVGGFMERALSNLLDAVEGKADLVSPPGSAIESERWAAEILGTL